MSKRIVGYFSGNVTNEEVQSKITGYTDVLFGFWVSPSMGLFGAADSIIRDPQIMDTVKKMGKKCILSAGGDAYVPFIVSNKGSASDTLTGTEYGTALAQFAQANNFDGVDLDIENFAVGAPDAITWLVDATNAVKATDASLSISHAPQAPYFLDTSNSYTDVEKRTNNAVDYYNIQYYNQSTSGYQAYDSYDKIFPKNFNGEPNPTSIESITASGIAADKLLVGKPITPADVNNTGYIKLSDLLPILKMAETNGVPFGGVMGWKIDSDKDGAWGDAVNATLNGKKSHAI